MQVEVVGTLKVSDAVSKDKGTAYKRREQEVYFHKAGEKYPLKGVISVPKEIPEGYALGKYELDIDKSTKIGDWGKLQFDYDMHLGKKVG